MKLSIIVPVYNAENYLYRCLRSILSQTFSDYELILVDDGSSDHSGDICDEICAKNEKTIVIHQKNGGALAARTRGLKEASGEYITFPDADDWLEPNYYETMMHDVVCHNVDIVAAGFTEEMEDGTKVLCENAIDTGEYEVDNEFMKQVLYSGKFYRPGIIASLWSKIIKRDLFKEELLQDDKIITNGDDALWTYSLIEKARKIFVNNDTKLYHYSIVPGSLFNRYDDMYFERILSLLTGLYDNLSQNEYAVNGLAYYALYMEKDALDRYMANNISKSRSKMVDEIEDFLESVRHIIAAERVDWQGFDDDSKAIIQHCIDCNSKEIVDSYTNSWEYRKKKLIYLLRKTSVLYKGKR